MDITHRCSDKEKNFGSGILTLSDQCKCLVIKCLDKLHCHFFFAAHRLQKCSLLYL